MRLRGLALWYVLVLPVVGSSQTIRIGDLEPDLKSPDPGLRLAAAKKLGDVKPTRRAGDALLRILTDPSEEVRLEAIRIAERMAVPLVDWVNAREGERVRLLKRTEGRWVYQYGAALFECSQTGSVATRTRVIRSLARMSSDNDIFFIPYTRCGTGADLTAPSQAGSALRRAGRESPEALRSMLTDKDYSLVQACTNALDAKDLDQRALLELVESEIPELKSIGASALSDAPGAVARWIRPTDDPDPRVSLQSTVFLAHDSEGEAWVAKLGPNATDRQLASRLHMMRYMTGEDIWVTQGARHPSAIVRGAALQVAFERERVIDVSILEAALRSDDAVQRSYALGLLDKVRPFTVEFWTKMLANESGQLQDMAAKILSEKSGLTIDALRGLLAFAESRKFDELSSYYLFRAFRPSSVTRVLIKELLRSSRESDRLLGFKYLDDAMTDKEAAIYWRLAKSDSSPDIRMCYARHIAYSELPNEVDELNSLLKDRAGEVRVEAVRYLISIGTRPALAAAAALVSDEDDQVAELASIAAEGLAVLDVRT